MVCRISPLLKRILWPDNISITLTSAFGTFLFDNKLIVDNISNPMTSKKVHFKHQYSVPPVYWLIIVQGHEISRRTSLFWSIKMPSNLPISGIAAWFSGRSALGKMVSRYVPCKHETQYLAMSV